MYTLHGCDKQFALHDLTVFKNTESSARVDHFHGYVKLPDGITWTNLVHSMLSRE